MWNKSHKKKASQIETLIGQKARVLGDIKFSGGLHIEGVIHGSVFSEADAQGMLSLGETGVIEGTVNATYVTLDGTVKGDVHGIEHVQLCSHARVSGDVYYNLIEIAVGAEVNGKLVHAPDAEAEVSGQIDTRTIEFGKE
ncbi:MAG: bactofilin family protein [Gammaproteobacteria bacterium]